jgi:hypothetical protein
MNSAIPTAMGVAISSAIAAANTVPNPFFGHIATGPLGHKDKC